MKNFDDFIELVKKMRKAQVEYFRTRSSIAMAEAKKLEREVDKLLPPDLMASRSSQEKLF
ncbi:MAG: hypothetical protein AAGB30_11140 [Pedobacter sp.]|nr:hypothetical protein [Cellulomonas sp.]